MPAHTGQLRRAVWEQRIAVSTYVVGGLAITGGLVMAYLNRPRLTEGETAEPGAVSIMPMISPRASGVTALWRF